MKPGDFVSRLREAYLNAQYPMYNPRAGAPIVRRTNHCIDSESEDLFACYCSSKIPKRSRCEIWVDPQITFPDHSLRNRSGKRGLLMRPDVCVIKRGRTGDKMVLSFDLKLDLGHKRNVFGREFGARRRLVSRIRGKEAKVHDRGINQDLRFKISKGLKHYFVIVTPKNFESEKKHRAIPMANDMHVLTAGIHPNSRCAEREFYQSIKINTAAFSRIDRALRSAAK